MVSQRHKLAIALALTLPAACWGQLSSGDLVGSILDGSGAGVPVEVTSAPAVIDTTTNSIQSTFDSAASRDLPIASIGLGSANLSLLNAGVASNGGIGVGEGPSVGGQRPYNNNFMIEGVDNNNKSVTGSLIRSIPNDAVAEFTVLQNQASAEFGHSSGGPFNTILRGGTNEIHGTLYECLSWASRFQLDRSSSPRPTTRTTPPRSARWTTTSPTAIRFAVRNTLQGRPINNWDLNLLKTFTITERFRFQASAQFYNLFNRAQFVPGFINRADNPPVLNTTGAVWNYLTPGNAIFNNPEAVFSSNPRQIQLAVKLFF